MATTMAGGGVLTPQEVVERLNRSLEEELSNLEGTLPTSPARPVPHQFLNTRWEVGATAPRTRANASLLDKLEASRLRALENLSSVLFDDGHGYDRGGGGGGGGAHPTPKDRVNWSSLGGRPGTHARGCAIGCKDHERRPPAPPARQPSLQQRLRRRAAVLVQQERESLLRELHAELGLERKRFEARKPALSEEAYRAARREHASAREKQEHELRMVLARREFKDLQDAARERLAIAHAQEKERTLVRLRRSLGRGTGHSVSGLREELWEEAQDKRTRALHEGEAAFEHSCRLLRQQSHDRIKAKMKVMAEEAAVAEQSAVAALREVEAKATSEELSRLVAELERERREAEAELKRQLHREAARSVSLAVDACTSKHKQAQQEATATAAEALRRALEVAGEEEVARAKAALEREARMLDDRRSSLISAVEDGLNGCSLRKLAVVGSPRGPLATTSPSSCSSSSSRSPVGRLPPSFSFLSTPSQPSPYKTLIPATDRNRSSLGGGRRKAEAGIPLVERPGSPATAGTAKGRDGGGGSARSPTVTGGGGKGVAADTDVDVDVDADRRDADRSTKAYAGCAAAAARAVKAVRHVEGAAAAAEREYAKRARDIVRLRAAGAPRGRDGKSIRSRNGNRDHNRYDVAPVVESEQEAREGVGGGRSRAEGASSRMAGGQDGGCAEGGGDLVGCGGCAVLFEANERLLEEARTRGFVNE